MQVSTLVLIKVQSVRYFYTFVISKIIVFTPVEDRYVTDLRKLEEEDLNYKQINFGNLIPRAYFKIKL